MANTPLTVDETAVEVDTASPVDAPRPSTTVGQRLLFLLFTLTGFTLFAAVTLLPMVEEHARLLDEEAGQAALVYRLETKKDSLHKLAADILDEPEKTEWLARVELGYQRPGETIVSIEPISPPIREVSTFGVFRDGPRSIVPRDWPVWAHAAENWAVGYGVLQPLMDRELRSIWLLLAGGIVISAFVVFAPRRRPESLSAPAAR